MRHAPRWLIRTLHVRAVSLAISGLLLRDRRRALPFVEVRVGGHRWIGRITRRTLVFMGVNLAPGVAVRVLRLLRRVNFGVADLELIWPEHPIARDRDAAFVPRNLMLVYNHGVATGRDVMVNVYLNDQIIKEVPMGRIRRKQERAFEWPDNEAGEKKKWTSAELRWSDRLRPKGTRVMYSQDELAARTLNRHIHG